MSPEEKISIREQLKDLIHTSFELFVQRHWLSVIDKEVRKYNQINKKYNRLVSELNSQKYLIKSLLDKYNELYDSNLELGDRRV